VYLRTVMKGSLGGVENWSISINWGIFGIAPDTPDQAMVDGVLLKLRNFTTAGNTPTSVKSLLSTTCSISGWRVEQRGEDERTLAVAEGTLTTEVAGTLTVSKTPQDCIVISLRTNTPGPRGRGRLYFPAMSATLSPTFQLTSPVPSAIAADFKTWLNAIGTQMNQYFIDIGSAYRVVLSVRSQTDHVNRNVVQLQVGSILDTQRRRRDALPETYASVAYP